MTLVQTIGFAPDVERTTPGALLECSNLVPTLKGMKAAPSNIVTVYPASAEAVTGAALLPLLSGAVRFFIGGATLLQEGVAGAWNNVSRGAGYTAGVNRWRFCQFGNDSIAANKSCQLQRSTGAGVAFANLTGPKADVCEVIDGQVMLGNCDDSGTGLATGYGDQPDRWWASAINDVATWTPSAATQCVTGRLVAAPGSIRAMRRLGPNCVAYKDKAIFLGSYVGPQAPIWRWDLVPGDIGCSSQECVVNIGTAHLFVGETDLYSFDGSRPVSIGAPIREWFFARLNRSYQYLMAALHDRPNGLVYWFYPSTASNSGALDEAIVYSYRTNRWGAVARDIEMPIELVLGGITYDNLGTLYTTYDDLPAIPYDSPFWIANSPVPAVIGTDHRPYTIGGEPDAWSFATSLYGDEQLVSLFERLNVRWITKPTVAALTQRYGMDESASLASATAVQMSPPTGRFDALISARWHQSALAGSGSMEFAGLDPVVKPESSE